MQKWILYSPVVSVMVAACPSTPHRARHPSLVKARVKKSGRSIARALSWRAAEKGMIVFELNQFPPAFWHKHYQKGSFWFSNMPRKPNDRLEGLALIWDESDTNRKNLREQGELLLCNGEVTFKPTAFNCSLNAAALMPVLSRISMLGLYTSLETGWYGMILTTNNHYKLRFILWFPPATTQEHRNTSGDQPFDASTQACLWLFQLDWNQRRDYLQTGLGDQRSMWTSEKKRPPSWVHQGPTAAACYNQSSLNLIWYTC